MKKIKFLSLIAIATASLTMSGQARKGALHINEVMTLNESNFVDDFGQRPAWIELYNSKFAPLEISSIYLTTDTTTAPESWYAVPLHDVNTRIPKRQHIVFWADGHPSRGTFHTSFTLDPQTVNDLYIIDSDKKTVIDHVTVPVLEPNTTYARANDGITVYDADGNIDVAATWEVRNDIDEGKYITPSSNNVILDSNDKVEKFSRLDPNGFAMAVMAMAIVFSALAILCIAFMIINKISMAASKAKSDGLESQEAPVEELPEDNTDEAIAAIAMALHEHLNAHDNESTILTINRVSSPWNAKIYGLRHLPGK
ncbi:MAG: OadG family protein [Muribaculaceae bacterium]|nr:OadG family protein [Muribaculaceae bacterium]